MSPQFIGGLALALLTFSPLVALAKCQSTTCLCVAENPSHAALRVLPSSVNLGFVNINEVLRPGDCDYSVGDSIDVSSSVEDDSAFAANPELIIGVNCSSNLQKYVGVADDVASCPDADVSAAREDVLELNRGEECTTDVNEVAPNPPCDDTEEGCCATTAPPATPWWALLGVVLLVIRRRP